MPNLRRRSRPSFSAIARTDHAAQGARGTGCAPRFRSLRGLDCTARLRSPSRQAGGLGAHPRCCHRAHETRTLGIHDRRDPHQPRLLRRDHGRRRVPCRTAIDCVSRRVLRAKKSARADARNGGGRGTGRRLESAEGRRPSVVRTQLAMAADRPGEAAPVKYEIVIDGKAADLSVTGERFEYRRGSGAAIERQYSVAPAAHKTWSILIDGRSYAVATLSTGEVSVNGRVFHVDVF